MGLDNSLLVSRLKRKKPYCFSPILSRFERCDYDCMSEEVYEVFYFRKCWGVRGAILSILENHQDNISNPVLPREIPNLIAILKRFNNEKYWDEWASSIWDYDDMKKNLRRYIWNLRLLRILMFFHPDYKLSFEDSY